MKAVYSGRVSENQQHLQITGCQWAVKDTREVLFCEVWIGQFCDYVAIRVEFYTLTKGFSL